jgi:hypothetical protein
MALTRSSLKLPRRRCCNFNSGSRREARFVAKKPTQDEFAKTLKAEEQPAFYELIDDYKTAAREHVPSWSGGVTSASWLTWFSRGGGKCRRTPDHKWRQVSTGLMRRISAAILGRSDQGNGDRRLSQRICVEYTVFALAAAARSGCILSILQTGLLT